MCTCIGLPDRQEHIPIDPTFNYNPTDHDVNQSTCQFDFATIHNRLATSNQPIMHSMTSTFTVITPSTTVNDAFSVTIDPATTNSMPLAILVAAVAGGILGLCTIVICIVGMFAVKRRKRKQNKVREGIFTAPSLTSIFDRYVTYANACKCMYLATSNCIILVGSDLHIHIM